MNTLTNWKDFFYFLKKPNYSKQVEGTKNKVLLTINSFLLEIILLAPFFLLYGYYIIVTGETSDHMGENVKKLYHPIILYSMIAIFEEFAFRGFLTKFNPLLFAISTSGIVSLFFKKIVFNNMFFEPNGLLETGFIMLTLLVPLYLIGKKYNTQISNFWKKNFNYIVYVSIFLFAFGHFFNSESWKLTHLKTTIFQLLGGSVLVFVRIRAGISYAIIMHFIFDIML